MPAICEGEGIETDQLLKDFFSLETFKEMNKDISSYLKVKSEYVQARCEQAQIFKAAILEQNLKFAEVFSCPDSLVFSLSAKFSNTINEFKSFISREQSQIDILETFALLYQYNLISHSYFSIGLELDLYVFNKINIGLNNALTENEILSLENLISSLKELARLTADTESRLKQGLEMIKVIKEKTFW